MAARATSPAAVAPAPAAHPGTLSVDAHDGMILQVGSTYILYGTSYGCGFKLLDHTTPWCGIRAYTSPDMSTWTDRGLMFDPEPFQTRCATDSFGCFRPHVVQRPDGSFVMWVNTADTSGEGYIVFTAPAPLGPWTPTGRSPHLAVDAGGAFAWGDEDIYVADGIGYIAYTAIGDYAAGNRHDIVIEQLTPDMTAGSGMSVKLGLQSVEAPSIFRQGGTWFLTYSDPICGYCGSTSTAYQTAVSPLGPWSFQGHISETSCNGQPAKVNQLTIGGAATLLYQSDTWQQLDGSFDPNQAAAPTHLEPITAAGSVLSALTCGATY